MPLPSSGQLCLSDIRNEFGGPSCLADYRRGGGWVADHPGTSRIPTSFPLCMSRFYSAQKNPPSQWPTNSLIWSQQGAATAVDHTLSGLGTFNKSLVILQWAHNGDGDSNGFGYSYSDISVVGHPKLSLGAYSIAWSDELHVVQAIAAYVGTANSVTVRTGAINRGRNDYWMGFYYRAHIAPGNWLPSLWSMNEYRPEGFGHWGSEQRRGFPDIPSTVKRYPSGTSYGCSVNNWGGGGGRTSIRAPGLEGYLEYGWGSAGWVNHPAASPSSEKISFRDDGWKINVVKGAFTLYRSS